MWGFGGICDRGAIRPPRPPCAGPVVMGLPAPGRARTDEDARQMLRGDLGRIAYASGPERIRMSVENGNEEGSVASSDDVALLVPSCDAYQDLWHPFFHCLFKYWPDCPYPVYLGSNAATYSHPRVRPILVGPDVDYTSNLIAMLGEMSEMWVLFWLEDWVLSAPLETTRLVSWIRAAQMERAAYLRPISIHPLVFSREGGEEIGEIPKRSRYRISMNIAVWNKQALLRLLRPGETIWDIERRGSRRSDELEDRFVAPTIHVRRNPPVSYMHLVVKGKLRREAREFLKREGLELWLAKRPVERLRSHWYSKGYFGVVDAYSVVKWQCQRWFG